MWEGSWLVEGLDRSFLAALGHPLRLTALVLFERRAASARELGELAGVSSTAAAYHVRTLEQAGLLRQEGSRRRRAFDEALWRTSTPGWSELEDHMRSMAPLPDPAPES
jgi:DNA-binding transcriptional ArsR family regulator